MAGSDSPRLLDLPQIGSGHYFEAYVDVHVMCACVRSSSPAAGEPFWRQASINAVWHLRVAWALSGDSGFTIHRAAGVLDSALALDDLVNSSVAGSGRSSVPESRALGLALAEWYRTFRDLDPRVRRRAVYPVTVLAESRIAVAVRPRWRAALGLSPDVLMVPLADRVGPWSAYDPSRVSDGHGDACGDAVACFRRDYRVPSGWQPPTLGSVTARRRAGLRALGEPLRLAERGLSAVRRDLAAYRVALRRRVDGSVLVPEPPGYSQRTYRVGLDLVEEGLKLLESRTAGSAVVADGSPIAWRLQALVSRIGPAEDDS